MQLERLEVDRREFGEMVDKEGKVRRQAVDLEYLVVGLGSRKTDVHMELELALAVGVPGKRRL